MISISSCRVDFLKENLKESSEEVTKGYTEGFCEKHIY